MQIFFIAHLLFVISLVCNDFDHDRVAQSNKQIWYTGSSVCTEYLRRGALAKLFPSSYT